MSARPEVSVVVPAYAYPQGVERLLRALTLQVRACRFEVIVVDDGSPEPLAPVVAACAGHLDVRCVRLANAGPARARNAGVAAAQARWILFTDHDCEPFPEWISNMVQAFALWPKALLGGAKVNGLPDDPWSVAHEAVCQFAAGWSSPFAEPFFSTNNLGVSRDSFLQLGGFHEQFPFAQEDRDFARRWRESGFPMQAVPEARVRHCHPLGAYTFCRQHFRYGQGAVDYYRVQSSPGPGWPVRERLRFYWAMAKYPWEGRSGPAWRAARTSLLMMLSQAMYAAGYFWRRMERPSNS